MTEYLPPDYYKPEVEFLLSLKQRLEQDLDGIEARLSLLLGHLVVDIGNSRWLLTIHGILSSLTAHQLPSRYS